MIDMTDERAAEVLAVHNEWRRYDGETGEPGAPEMGDPAELGRAIDHAVSRLRSQPPAEAQGGGERKPDGFHYRYRDPYGGEGTIIRTNNGLEVNGSRPIEAVPYYYTAPPSAPVGVDAGWYRYNKIAPRWEDTKFGKWLDPAVYGPPREQHGYSLEVAALAQQPVGVEAEDAAAIDKAWGRFKAALAQQPAAVEWPCRLVDGVVTVNGIALDEVVRLGDRYAATIEKRGMPRAAQVFEALVLIGKHALAAQQGGRSDD